MVGLVTFKNSHVQTVQYLFFLHDSLKHFNELNLNTYPITNQIRMIIAMRFNVMGTGIILMNVCIIYSCVGEVRCDGYCYFKLQKTILIYFK